MKEKYIEDLRSIKDIMNRSSRFISLSGLSGISAGIIALTGAFFAHRIIYKNNDYLSYARINLTFDTLFQVLIIAAATLLLAIGAGIFFTTRQAKKQNQKIWDRQSKRLIINLAIPLITGGLFCLIILLKGYVGITAPLTLIFYGLALVNASKYTLNEIRSLGIIEIILGLTASWFIGYGLLFWSIGFGVFHILYGIVMYSRYKS